MKKFVTSLIITLPLLLLIAIFAVTGVASISAQIPVSGLTIANRGDDGIFMLDIADYDAPIYEDDLCVTITPYAASDKRYSLSVLDAETNEPTDIVYKDDAGAFRIAGIGVAKLVYTSLDGGYSDSVIFNVIDGTTEPSVNYVSPTELSPENIIVFNGYDEIFTMLFPANALTHCEWEIPQDGIAEIVETADHSCTLHIKSRGETTLTARVTEFDEHGNETNSYIVQRNLSSVQRYTSMLFRENATMHGLANRLAIASRVYDDAGNAVQINYALGFAAYNKTIKFARFDDIVFESSNPSVATVENNNGKLELSVKGTGTVTITASYRYGEKANVPDAKFTFDAVDGVYVKTYADIMRASDEGRKIVLANDISLGEQLFNVNEDGVRTQKYGDQKMQEILLAETKTLKTTADWTYLKNRGEEHPSIRYCLEFTNDVYGNGHTIDADNIINMCDSTGSLYDYAVFRGPLEFVYTAMKGLKVAAVKAQDNVAFLVRRDGILINNVTLKSMRDESLTVQNEIDLTLLNNAGTTLEIMCDASVNYSRIMNGRTVLRAFGRDGIDETSPVDVEREKINVQISGCVLQNAREFIVKISTNRRVQGSVETPSPSLLNADGEPYENYNSTACDDYIDDEYFTSHYLLTDVTIKDSTLKTSGLFSIGMESHFAGRMLAGDEKIFFRIEYWNDLAATSYPAIVRLVGDVRLDDWKELGAVDSSTLIDTPANVMPGLEFLTLNIKEMLLAVQQAGGEQYADIIANVNGKQYVHGGIALYGGGKNYSIVDTSAYTGRNMNSYNVNLSILETSENPVLAAQGEYLPLAAGKEDFRFIMFGAGSFEAEG
ncbi:MAG: Ig-like domain-containing protein [Clostridia bacterium]|nr:Ig-like domain-containing protein [Clostridia bacterium]